MASVADFVAEWLSPTPYVEAHTSGSTGKPKRIRLLKSDMRVSAANTNEFFGIGCDSVLALPLSVDYIAGKMMVVRSLEAGCRLIELPVSNSVVIPARVDLLSMVPSQIDGLLQDAQAGSKVRSLLLGGAPVGAQAAGRLIDAGVNSYVGYGMTETCSHVALRSLADGSGIFGAMPGIWFETDSRGCLVVRSDRFSWNTLVTNDMVSLVDSRSFVWLGRADNVINSGGLKIHPESVEALVANSTADFPPFYITGEPDERWGARVVMVVQGSASEYPDLLDRLGDIITDHRYLPRRVIFVDRLPSTPGGNKLLRLTPDRLSRTC